MSQFFIYKITNTINNKIYFGKTNNIKKRWAKHISSSKVQNPKDFSYIHRAINKYGKENFIIEEIACYESETEALQAEVNFIAQYNSRNRDIGYNISIGGDRGMTGYVHTQETKDKISKANTGKIMSDETRALMSFIRTGSKRSEETKKKQSVARLAQSPMSEDQKNKISETKKSFNLKLSDERKLQNSLSSRGENNKSAKLTETIVKDILLKKKEGWKRKQLIEYFQLPPGTIDGIIYGVSWSYLSKDTLGAALDSSEAEK